MIAIILKIGISSFLASLSFGFVFNIKGKKLLFAAITGAIGGVLYKLGLYYGMSELTSNFIGALILSICAEIFARVYKTPVTTFIVCGLIPLVPGDGMYRTMLEVVEGDVQGALNLALDTLSIAGVLALAILMVSTFTRFYFKTKKAIDMGKYV